MTNTQTYTADLGFDILVLEMNLSEASAPIKYFEMDLSGESAPIKYADDDVEAQSTPYTTADARHDASQALRLVVEYLGADYYADPSSELSADEQLDQLLDGVECVEVER